MTVFPSATAYGQFTDALATDAEWLTVWAEAANSGAGDLVTGSVFHGIMGFEA